MIDNWDYAYDENEVVTCQKCKWTGKMKDTKQRRRGYEQWNQDTGELLESREGYEYACPRCEWLIQAHWHTVG